MKGDARPGLPVWKIVSWLWVGFCVLLIAVGAMAPSPRVELSERPALVQVEGGALAPPAKLSSPMRELSGGESWFAKGVSFLGIFAFIGMAWAMSNNRRKVDWKMVTVGTVMQLVFAALIFFDPRNPETVMGSALHTVWPSWLPVPRDIFDVANDVFVRLLGFTNEGTKFLFGSFVHQGEIQPGLINFAFAILPTIIFFSSFMTVLYHVGVMQAVVKAFAWVMQRLMKTSGAESLSAAANIFVGQTEAPLVVKPFIERMTMSELMTVMTGGFATVAGGVLALYVGILTDVFPEIAGHLIAASVMSAPAALVIGKVMYPEDGTPETLGRLDIHIEKPDANVVEAAARGAGEGLQLALNVGAMLLAFIALIALLNYLVGAPMLWHNRGEVEALVEFFQMKGMTVPEGCAKVADGGIKGCVEAMQGAAGAPAVSLWHVWTIQELLGYLMWPIAWLMGVPAQDCLQIGQLLGTKMVLNELVAYIDLSTMLRNPEAPLAKRSVVIVTYALCGFANFSSIAIQIGGLGSIAPSRRHDLAKLGFRAMIAGSIAAFMTATIAGILV
jgi:CNT family concentrative nucleoside transporter